MNLRTLKKLSKRAAPLLPLLGDLREPFRAGRHRNYHKCYIGDLKHWERSGCHPTYQAGTTGWLNVGRTHEIVWNTRAGRRIVMRPPCHPRAGTIMVGAVSGYYEPEWDEESAWDALKEAVYTHFTDYRFDEAEEDVIPVPLRGLNTVGDFFRAAADIIAERRKERRG